MAVTYSTAPDDVSQEALSGLRRTAKKPNTRLSATIASLERPHRVFTMDPSDIKQTSDLGSAKLAGWHYFVRPESQGEVTSGSVVEVLLSQGRPKFSHRQAGWLVDRGLRILKSIESDPDLKDRGYTVTLLRIPAVARTDAIWLKSDSGQDDVVIPIACASSLLQPGRKYEPATFLDELRAIVASRVDDPNG